MISYIKTADAPQPAGHYSQAVVHNGIVYVAGQLAIDPETRTPLEGPIEAQAQLALHNTEAILKAAGSGKEHVLNMTIYVSDISLWGAVNEVYAAFFGDHKPARAIVPSRDLHYGLLIELSCIAAIPS